jgi:hypothetical protein
MPHGPSREEWDAWGEYLITDYVSAEEPPQLLVNAMFRYASMWASTNILAGTAPFLPLTPENGAARRVDEVGKWLITRDIISGNLSAAESPISPVLHGTHHAESPDYSGAWEAWRAIAKGFGLERFAEATRDTEDHHSSRAYARYARIRCHNMSREVGEDMAADRACRLDVIQDTMLPMEGAVRPHAELFPDRMDPQAFLGMDYSGVGGATPGSDANAFLDSGQRAHAPVRRRCEEGRCAEGPVHNCVVCGRGLCDGHAAAHWKMIPRCVEAGEYRNLLPSELGRDEDREPCVGIQQVGRSCNNLCSHRCGVCGKTSCRYHAIGHCVFQGRGHPMGGPVGPGARQAHLQQFEHTEPSRMIPLPGGMNTRYAGHFSGVQPERAVPAPSVKGATLKYHADGETRSVEARLGELSSLRAYAETLVELHRGGPAEQGREAASTFHELCVFSGVPDPLTGPRCFWREVDGKRGVDEFVGAQIHGHRSSELERVYWGIWYPDRAYGKVRVFARYGDNNVKIFVDDLDFWSTTVDQLRGVVARKANWTSATIGQASWAGGTIREGDPARTTYLADIGYFSGNENSPSFIDFPRVERRSSHGGGHGEREKHPHQIPPQT